MPKKQTMALIVDAICEGHTNNNFMGTDMSIYRTP